MTNEIKIPLTFCRLLKNLQSKEKIPIGKFSSKINKQLLQEFCDEKVLLKSRQSRAEYVYCPNNSNLNNYLQKFGINNLQNYIQFLKKENTTRAEATQATTNSKHKKNRIFNGFFVKTYLNIFGEINNQKFSLKPPQGTWIYIENYKTFKIDKDITVVGVENTETFTLINNYKHLFNKIKPVFLLRYNNNSYIEWLKNIENKYLHFGDFDLSAIAIYITEFRNKLQENKCDFFIPENIGQLIKQSLNKKDFLKQLNDPKIKNLKFEHYPEISQLAKLIYKEKRTMEQEILMKQ